jgi:hypothetical protein
MNDKAYSEPSERTLLAGVWWMIGTLVIGVICALATRHGCLHPGPPVIAPEASTPRAEFCSTIDGGSPWWSFVVGPAVLVALAWTVTKDHPRVFMVTAAFIWLALICAAGLANSLNYSLTL